MIYLICVPKVIAIFIFLNIFDINQTLRDAILWDFYSPTWALWRRMEMIIDIYMNFTRIINPKHINKHYSTEQN